MDRPILVDSRGGIVTPATPYPGSHYAPAIQEWLPDIVPYVEPVALPVPIVDSSAVYGSRPQDLLQLTVSSGAALTFFVDSLAGGNDSTGKGSYDDPWRSLNTASNFIKCAECILNTACQYIQIKIRGTVDYVSSSWNPKSYHSKTLILTGWDGVCDLGSSGTYHAGYIFNAKARSYFYGATVHSGGAIYSAGPSSTAVDCEFSGGTAGVAVSVACNCSGACYAEAEVCRGGVFTSELVVDYAYMPVVNRVVTSGYSAYGLNVHSAACGATVTLTGENSNPNDQTSLRLIGFVGRNGATVIDCSATVTAVDSGSRAANATAFGCSIGAAVVSGGFFAATAYAGAVASDNLASAYAYAGGVAAPATVYAAATVLNADAWATIVGTSAASAQEMETETTANLTTRCVKNRIRYLSSGVVYSSSYTSSGSCQ